MQARSLKSLLTRQWIIFAAVVAVVFASAGLLLLFLLEDSFIDRQLEAAARQLSVGGSELNRLPAEISVFPVADAPLDIHARLPFAQAGEPFEMRRANRRHVHVLLVDDATRGRLAIVYDATDQLTVSPRAGTGLLLLLGLTSLALTSASLLARAFVARITRQGERLAHQVRASPDPENLRELARAQQVLEFQHLLALHADIWDSQRAAVENERQTLVYLAHELRTPLQSAQTSLALLAEGQTDAATLERLQRALSRLTRASQAALWLATDREPDMSTSAPLLLVVERLVSELAPLAERAGQRVEVDVTGQPGFGGPAEIAEAILANLLLNAIQHGGPGAITIHGTADRLVITNPCREESESGGFGIGLEIVRRLAIRIGWAVDFSRSEGSAVTRVDLGAVGPSDPT